MLNYWDVTALKMGELTVEKSSLTHQVDIGKKVNIPIWAAAISGGGYKILVDTGIHDKSWVEKNVSPCKQEKDEYITEALKKGVGWDPSEVDIVINTHLHYDHCGNNHLFKNARFILQKREWEAAFNPIYSQRTIYLKELYDENAVNYFSWHFVDGEVEVCPGVKVFLTPGHSEGHQSVIVNTKEGTLCVAGDISNLMENIEKNITAGILTNPKDMFKGMAKVRSLATKILPGHEPRIEKYQTNNFLHLKPFEKDIV